MKAVQAEGDGDGQEEFPVFWLRRRGWGRDDEPVPFSIPLHPARAITTTASTPYAMTGLYKGAGYPATFDSDCNRYVERSLLRHAVVIEPLGQ